MKYEEAKKAILVRLAAGELIPVDTNVIISAAEKKDTDFLEKLKSSPLFMPTNVNINEINGLVINQRFDATTLQILSSFAQAVKNRIGTPADTKRLERELSELAPLLPRSVANYVIITFVTNLIKRYRSLVQEVAKLTQEKLDELSNIYKKEVAELKSKCEERYFELIDKLAIGEFDDKKYFADVNKFLNKSVHEIEQVAVEARGDINMILVKLQELKDKTYYADIKFVATAIATGTTGISQDSDVLWLFTFHALRRVS